MISSIYIWIQKIMNNVDMLHFIYITIIYSTYSILNLIIIIKIYHNKLKFSNRFRLQHLYLKVPYTTFNCLSILFTSMGRICTKHEREREIERVNNTQTDDVITC